MIANEDAGEGALRICRLEDDFVKDLHDNVSGHVFLNSAPSYKHARKHLGTLLEINGFPYYAPLSSPKNSDYTYVKGHRVIRNSIPAIIRMVESDENGRRSLLGTIKLGSMLPVPRSALLDYDLGGEGDDDYKALVLKEKGSSAETRK